MRTYNVKLIKVEHMTTNRELIFVKPDAIERKLVGKIIARFEEAGFRIERMRKGRISPELAALLYGDSEAQLSGMGNKTLKAMMERGDEPKIMEIFGTKEPYRIGQTLNSWNKAYAVSADVIALIIQKEDAANAARALVGKTDPSAADRGTIRGDFGEDSIYQGNLEKRACRNLVHASDDDTAPTDVKNFEERFFNS